MRFPQLFRFNWPTALVLMVFALLGVVFLVVLLLDDNSDSLKAGSVQPSVLQTKPVPHLHPHPHPHSDVDESNNPNDSEVEAPASVKNEIEKNEPEAETSEEEDTAGRVLGAKGVLSAFQPALKLQFTDPELAYEKLHEIAEELGEGDMELTEYFHLKGHTLFNGFADAEGFFLPLKDAIRYFELKEKIFGLHDEEKKILAESRADRQWNIDGQEVFRQTQPIRDVLTWMEENAPAEWEVVNQRYIESLKERSAPGESLIEEWQTIKERTDLRYEIFFEALEVLPEDAYTLQVFFESTQDAAQEKLLSQQEEIQMQPAPPLPPELPPEHTWDIVHEPPSIDNASPQLPPNTTLGPANLAELEKILTTTSEVFEKDLRSQFSPTRFNLALELIHQYGQQEGIRRLKETDPAIAVAIETYIQDPR